MSNNGRKGGSSLVKSGGMTLNKNQTVIVIYILEAPISDTKIIHDNLNVVYDVIYHVFTWMT